MENIKNFIEAIKSIQMNQVIDIVIAILVYILFRCLSKSLAYITVKIFKPKSKNKKEIRNNAFYNPLKVFYVILGIYIAILFIRKPLGISDWWNLATDKLFKISISVVQQFFLLNRMQKWH